MIVTANLAKGAVTMSRHKVIVKRLNAIQNFGAMDVLCTDKTGTLTQDKIVLERHLDVDGEEDDEVLEFALPEQLLPDRPEEPARRGGAGAGRGRARAGDRQGIGKVDEIPFDFTAGGCRWWSTTNTRPSSSARARSRRCWRSAFVRDDDAQLDEASVLELEPNCATTRAARRRAQRGRAAGRRGRVSRRSRRRTARTRSPTRPSSPWSASSPSSTRRRNRAAPALQALADNGIAVKVLTGDNELVRASLPRRGLDVGHVVSARVDATGRHGTGAIAVNAHGLRQADARRRRPASSRAAGATGTPSASWATASTTPAPCARPTSASPSTRRSISRRNRPTSSCWRRV